jgi:hypothetical protein
MRYFVRRPSGAPMYVFRITPDLSIELYDVAAHAWTPRPLEPLYRWAVIDPGIGVDEISADEAAAIIHELTFGRSAGRRRGPDRLRPRAA